MNKKLVAGLLGCGLAAGIILARPVIGAKFAPNGPDPAAVMADLPALETSFQQGKQGADKTDKLALNPEDSSIAVVVSRLLARYNYMHHPLDEATSAKMVTKYLDLLDPMHMYFLKSDIDEFEAYKKTAGPMLWDKGDTSPANKIFVRYLQRFDEQNTYANNLIKSPPADLFTFTSNDSFMVNRKDQPYPQNEEDAKQIWQQRLRYEYLQEKLNKQSPEEIVKVLTRRYSRTFHSIHELDHDDIFEIYLTALSQTYDPHSSYMGKAATANFGIDMRLSLVGIGAILTSEEGYAKINELVPGGPAIKSGQMKVGDRIVSVAQGDGEPVDVVDMKLDNVVEKIRGTKGTKVKLTIIPVDAPDPSVRKTITLVRDEVKLEEREASAKVIDMPDSTGKTSRIAVIDVPSFYEDSEHRDEGGKSSTADVARLLKRLENENVKGVILDLRKNPGGSLPEAYKMSGLFIKDGPVVQVRNSDGSVKVYKDPDPNIVYGGPLVVLTSRFSASAAEILAGALQDYGRALVVGDASTHGKGSVQTILPLGELFEGRGMKLNHDPGALRVTIQKFYRVNGSSTQLNGVVPDIVLPSLSSVVAPGEKSLDNAMVWDTIASTSYTKFNAIQPSLETLRKRSQARVAADKDFVYLQSEMERFKKLQADKSVSLNEEQRRQEKDENTARAEARKKELLARPKPTAKVYSLTLKQIALPKLQLAVDKPAEKPKTAVDGDDTAATEPALPSLDITLNETERILLDLMSLTPKTAGTSVRR